MIASGAGLAPYVCMLRHGRDALGDRERIVVVHTVRRTTHLSYGDQIAAMAQDDPRIRYVPVVTRDEGLQVRHGHAALIGRVQDHIASGDLERAADAELGPDVSAAMLCGNPTMIKEVSATLTSRGMRKHLKRKPGHVVSERYW